MALKLKLIESWRTTKNKVKHLNEFRKYSYKLRLIWRIIFKYKLKITATDQRDPIQVGQQSEDEINGIPTSSG